MPGMVLATIFVSLPFVVREVVPVLHEIGDEQEQAAQTLGANWWQTFWRITLPAIRWGVAYGVVLATARALGEFGAVAVVSGRISGQTETAPLWVWREFGQFNTTGAYTASLVLALIADRDPARDELVQAKGSLLMSIIVEGATEAVRRLRRPRRRLDRGAGRLADGPARAERQRQVDAAAGDRRASSSPTRAAS